MTNERLRGGARRRGSKADWCKKGGLGGNGKSCDRERDR
jgi:hypothetical protein